MPTINAWLNSAKNQLIINNIPSPVLDSELILAHAYNKSRTYLHANNELEIPHDISSIADKNIKKRSNHMPIAYITGHKEFYGRDFIITSDTLIPRPESETIIDVLKQIPTSHFPIPNPQLVDVGTGSGCLGITIKKELPNMSVTLSDISDPALQIAQINADNNSAVVKIINSDLLKNIDMIPNIIVANLPYVDKSWQRSPETNYEPSLALFAQDGGMQIIKRLIDQANNKLAPNGYLIIEADPEQHEQLINYSEKKSFKLIESIGYIITLQITKKLSTK